MVKQIAGTGGARAWAGWLAGSGSTSRSILIGIKKFLKAMMIKQRLIKNIIFIIFRPFYSYILNGKAL